MADSFDVIVIGAGPGGYVAAIRAAQLGMSVACVDKRDSLGGTCLNIGCIPSKALLQSSEKYAEAQHALAQHGIKVGERRRSISTTMMARKDKVVAENTSGIDFLFRKNKVEHVKGAAQIRRAPTALDVDGTRARGEARDHHRHRLGQRAAAGRRDRREDHPLLDRRACRSPRCRSGWSWSAAAISGSSWARCGAGSAPR